MTTTRVSAAIKAADDLYAAHGPIETIEDAWDLAAALVGADDAPVAIQAWQYYSGPDEPRPDVYA